MHFQRGCAVGLGLLLAISSTASASEPLSESFTGTRALGMGGGMRAAASGGTGPLQNPSGMSLVPTYNVEADYLFARVRSGHLFHASIVDSTSAFKIAGGIYYTYHFDGPDQPVPSAHGHEGGLALSLPFGDHVFVGGTLKYLHLSGFEATPEGGSGGLTFDAGATVRPIGELAIGVVGTNLRRLHVGTAPTAIGYGAALSVGTNLLLVVDAVTNLTVDLPLPRKGTRVSAGGELMLAQKFVLRLGGGYDGITQNGFFTAGLSAISEAGSLDFGLRQDAFSSGAAPRETVLGASFRVFVPQP
jgi:hypothetical protein